VGWEEEEGEREGKEREEGEEKDGEEKDGEEKDGEEVRQHQQQVERPEEEEEEEEDEGKEDEEKKEDLMLLAVMVLKCADISNIARPFALSRVREALHGTNERRCMQPMSCILLSWHTSPSIAVYSIDCLDCVLIVS
jgi:hypothetical protein